MMKTSSIITIAALFLVLASCENQGTFFSKEKILQADEISYVFESDIPDIRLGQITRKRGWEINLYIKNIKMNSAKYNPNGRTYTAVDESTLRVDGGSVLFNFTFDWQVQITKQESEYGTGSLSFETTALHTQKIFMAEWDGKLFIKTDFRTTANDSSHIFKIHTGKQEFLKELKEAWSNKNVVDALQKQVNEKATKYVNQLAASYSAYFLQVFGIFRVEIDLKFVKVRVLPEGIYVGRKGARWSHQVWESDTPEVPALNFTRNDEIVQVFGLELLRAYQQELFKVGYSESFEEIPFDPTFNYTVAAVSKIVPDVLNKFAPEQGIRFIFARWGSQPLTFNKQTQKVEIMIHHHGEIYTKEDGQNVFNFHFNASYALDLSFKNSIATSKIADASIVDSWIEDRDLTDAQTAQMSSWLNSMIRTYVGQEIFPSGQKFDFLIDGIGNIQINDDSILLTKSNTRVQQWIQTIRKLI